MDFSFIDFYLLLDKLRFQNNCYMFNVYNINVAMVILYVLRSQNYFRVFISNIFIVYYYYIKLFIRY